MKSFCWLMLGMCLASCATTSTANGSAATNADPVALEDVLRVINKAFTQADDDLTSVGIGLKSVTVSAQVRKAREGEMGLNLFVISASDNQTTEISSQITVTLEKPKTPPNTPTANIDDVYNELVAAIKGAASAAKAVQANSIPSLDFSKVTAEIAFTVTRKKSGS